MTFSTRLRNLDTARIISEVSNDLTAFFMSSLRAVTLLWGLAQTLTSIQV